MPVNQVLRSSKATSMMHQKHSKNFLLRQLIVQALDNNVAFAGSTLSHDEIPEKKFFILAGTSPRGCPVALTVVRSMATGMGLNS